MKFALHFLTISFLLTCQLALAATPVLGFEINVSSVNHVKSSLSRETVINDSGINAYTLGPMLKTNGSSYDIEGLHEVLYVFDEQQVLVAVFMDMDKSRFDDIYKALAHKYKVTSQNRPFVGNKYARFKTPDTIIEMDAPHMSFRMMVSYTQVDLFKKYKAQSARELEAKKNKEASKF